MDGCDSVNGQVVLTRLSCEEHYYEGEYQYETQYEGQMTGIEVNCNNVASECADVSTLDVTATIYCHPESWMTVIVNFEHYSGGIKCCAAYYIGDIECPTVPQNLQLDIDSDYNGCNWAVATVTIPNTMDPCDC